MRGFQMNKWQSKLADRYVLIIVMDSVISVLMFLYFNYVFILNDLDSKKVAMLVVAKVILGILGVLQVVACVLTVLVTSYLKKYFKVKWYRVNVVLQIITILTYIYLGFEIEQFFAWGATLSLVMVLLDYVIILPILMILPLLTQELKAKVPIESPKITLPNHPFIRCLVDGTDVEKIRQGGFNGELLKAVRSENTMKPPYDTVKNIAESKKQTIEVNENTRSKIVTNLMSLNKTEMRQSQYVLSSHSKSIGPNLIAIAAAFFSAVGVLYPAIDSMNKSTGIIQWFKYMVVIMLMSAVLTCFLFLILQFLNLIHANTYGLLLDMYKEAEDSQQQEVPAHKKKHRI